MHVCVCVCVCVCVHERGGGGEYLVRFQEGRRNLQSTSGEDDGLSPKLEDLAFCAVVAALVGSWPTGGRHLEAFVVFQDSDLCCAGALKKTTFRRFLDFFDYFGGDNLHGGKEDEFTDGALK